MCHFSLLWFNYVGVRVLTHHQSHKIDISLCGQRRIHLDEAKVIISGFEAERNQYVFCQRWRLGHYLLLPKVIPMLHCKADMERSFVICLLALDLTLRTQGSCVVRWPLRVVSLGNSVHKRWGKRILRNLSAHQDQRYGVERLITCSSHKSRICLNNWCSTLIKRCEYFSACL